MRHGQLKENLCFNVDDIISIKNFSSSDSLTVNYYGGGTTSADIYGAIGTVRA